MTVTQQLSSDLPAFHQGGAAHWSALPGILAALEQSVGPAVRSVETGCGASTVVFAAGGGEHTVISPDGREHELVRAYCDEQGIGHSGVTFVADSSDRVLPRIATPDSLDLVFIDGAHSFPYAIVDWHYLSLALKVGGRMLVDDVAIPSITPLFHFMKSDAAWRFESLPDNRAALFTKLAEPDAVEDYTRQPYNRHSDFSFAPPLTRARLVGESIATRSRRSVGRRLPALRTVYRRLNEQR